MSSSIELSSTDFSASFSYGDSTFTNIYAAI